MGERLRDVLAAHWEFDVDNGGDQTELFCDGCKETLAVGGGADVDDRHRAHVAAAVTAWIEERLGDAAVVEAVVRAMYRDVDEFGIDMREAADAHADAALTAVRDALGVQEAGKVPESARNGARSAEQGCGGVVGHSEDGEGGR